MGIYDRDYYREKSGFSPLDNPLQASVVLAVIYVGFFLFQFVTLENQFRGRFSPVAELLELDAHQVMQGEVWRIFTYGLVQNASIWTLAFNVLFLVWFGRQVEDIYGWKEFLAYYLLAGLLAGAGFTLVSAILPDQMRALAGPATSLTATLFLFALHYPHRTVLLFFVLPCPVWLLAVLYVVVSLSAFFGGSLNPAAFAAYAVAAGFAYVYFRYSLRVSNWLPRMPSASGRPRARPSLQIFRDESRNGDTASTTAPSSGGLPASASYASAHSAAGGSAAPPSALDEHLEAKVDEVLKKVQKFGQDSLTDEERAILFRASEIYRKKRKPEGN